MPHIDLNCDLGESFGAYTIGMDENEKVLFKNTCSMYGRYNGIYTIYTSGNIDWQ